MADLSLRNVSGGSFSDEIGGRMVHVPSGGVFACPEDRARFLLTITPPIVVKAEAPKPVAPAVPEKGKKKDL